MTPVGFCPIQLSETVTLVGSDPHPVSSTVFLGDLCQYGDAISTSTSPLYLDLYLVIELNFYIPDHHLYWIPRNTEAQHF